MSKRFLLLLLPLALVAATAWAQDGDQVGDQDGDLESTLSEVGEEYALAYLAPLIHSWGANQNSGLFHTAHIPQTGITWSVGVKVQGTYLAESDQSFRKVLRGVELNDYLDLQPGDPYYGETGDIVFEGPTAFGDTETEGTATAYVDGLPVYQEGTITGLVDTRWSPLFAPEVQVGGIAGLRLSLRWLPEIDLSEVGKTKLFGYGLQWSPNYLLPTWPVDVMVGFSREQIDVGTILTSESQSFYVAASKPYGIATIYGGFAKESSTVSVTYEESGSGARVDFEEDGIMENRLTLGATLDLGVMLNAEMGVGDLVVYNVGLLFGM